MPWKAHIVAQLQQDILALQGYKPPSFGVADNTSLGGIRDAFPNAVFPQAGVHEFVCESGEEAAASSGFVSALVSSLTKKAASLLWVASSPLVFPPALKSFGLQPEQVIFLRVKKEADACWAVEEALQCTSLLAVVGEVKDVSFTASRRFQLAIEKSGVACFLLRHNPRNATTACHTRWRIRPLPTQTLEDLPGVGYPRWQVNLLKVRGGKPGRWEMEWIKGGFKYASKLAFIESRRQTKTG